jgi:hypothetical protein
VLLKTPIEQQRSQPFLVSILVENRGVDFCDPSPQCIIEDDFQESFSELVAVHRHLERSNLQPLLWCEGRNNIGVWFTLVFDFQIKECQQFSGFGFADISNFIGLFVEPFCETDVVIPE